MTSGRRGAGTPVFAAAISATCVAWFLAGCTRQPPATGANETFSPTPLISQGSSNADAAEVVAARSLALVKLPRGASIVAAPLVPSTSSTSDPTSPLSSDYLVDRALWYSVRGTPASVLRYVAGHVPPGFTAGGTQGSEVYFNGAPTGQYEGPVLAVEVEARSGRVLVDVDAKVSWRPVRSAEELIPDAATTGILVENGTGGAPTTVRLTPTQSRALADVFNSLWALSPPPYPLACAMGTTISARFTWPGNELDFVPDCEGIGVVANGVAQSELEDSYDLLPVRDAFFAFAASPPPPPAGPSPNPSSIPAAPSTAAESPGPTGPHLVLTNADQGRVITVAVGTFIDVNLKASPPTTVDPAVTDDYFALQPLDFSSGSTSTSQASFRAAAKGNVKLFAMTRPVCATFPACGAAPVFEFDVIVIATP